ncbi:MAG TPA: copper-binding protein [Gemmataceae bacterium]|jgi:Cu/Ag efflux protein CusF|nr:copper-binding protein [Gemmataceae bacterium]
MMTAHRWRGVVLILSLGLVGCTGGTPGSPTGPAPGEYDIKAKVVAVDASKPAVTLDHEDIPGLMKGMEMEFRVEGPQILDGLKPGDQVQGRLKKTDSGYVITRLEKR